MERKSNTEAYENTKRRQRSQRYGYISEEEWSGNDYQDDAPTPPRKKPRRAVDETDEERKERLRNERLESLSDEEFREYNRACDRGDRGADEFWAKYGL
jgi:hypothetical protein